MYGIRAHPDMNWTISLWSIFVPWHNEFLVIWIYIGFAIYFWIECILLMFHHKSFKFQRGYEYDLMFITDLGIAISLSATVAFLIFYSISEEICKILD